MSNAPLRNAYQEHASELRTRRRVISLRINVSLDMGQIVMLPHFLRTRSEIKTVLETEKSTMTQSGIFQGLQSVLKSGIKAGKVLLVRFELMWHLEKCYNSDVLTLLFPRKDSMFVDAREKDFSSRVISIYRVAVSLDVINSALRRNEC